MDYVKSFGAGKVWYDYLLLPINIYLHHDKFGTFMGSMEMPSPLFLFVLAYPWLRKTIDSETRKTLDVLGLVLIILFIFWAFGSQQIRFLLPLFPGLCILTSAVFEAIAVKLNKHQLGNAIKIGTVGGMVLATLIFMVIYSILIRPERVILGFDSKQDFLVRVLRDYPGITYINDHLQPTDETLFLWDGRAYYCNANCSADIDQSRWTALIQKTDNIAEVFEWLDERKITHILLSNEDITYFILKHDQQNKHLKAVKFLLDEYIPKCGQIIHEDNWTHIYQISPIKSSCK